MEEQVPEKKPNRKKNILFGSLGCLAVILVGVITWAILKAYEPFKTVASTQSTVKTISSPTQPSIPQSTVARIVPDQATSSAIDALQPLLQNDLSNDTAVNTALTDNQRQISVPTE